MHTHMNDSTLLFNLIFDTMMQNVSVKSMTKKFSGASLDFCYGV